MKQLRWSHDPKQREDLRYRILVLETIDIVGKRWSFVLEQIPERLIPAIAGLPSDYLTNPEHVQWLSRLHLYEPVILSTVWSGSWTLLWPISRKIFQAHMHRRRGKMITRGKLFFCGLLFPVFRFHFSSRTNIPYPGGVRRKRGKRKKKAFSFSFLIRTIYALGRDQQNRSFQCLSQPSEGFFGDGDLGGEGDRRDYGWWAH